MSDVKVRTWMRTIEIEILTTRLHLALGGLRHAGPLARVFRSTPVSVHRGLLSSWLLSSWLLSSWLLSSWLLSTNGRGALCCNVANFVLARLRHLDAI